MGFTAAYPAPLRPGPRPSAQNPTSLSRLFRRASAAETSFEQHQVGNNTLPYRPVDQAAVDTCSVAGVSVPHQAWAWGLLGSMGRPRTSIVVALALAVASSSVHAVLGAWDGTCSPNCSHACPASPQCGHSVADSLVKCFAPSAGSVRLPTTAVLHSVSRPLLTRLVPACMHPVSVPATGAPTVSAPGGAGHALQFRDHVLLKKDFKVRACGLRGHCCWADRPKPQAAEHLHGGATRPPKCIKAP